MHVVRAHIDDARTEFVLASQLLSLTFGDFSMEILPTMASLLLSAFIGATIYAIGAQVV